MQRICSRRFLSLTSKSALQGTASFGTKRLASLTSQQNEQPSGAEVVIAGGGVVGCSVAYHLGKRNVKNVVLLEQGSIGCGTTWHAAGLIGTLKSSFQQTLLAKYATHLYAVLEEETGQSTGFKRNGSLTIARTKDRAIVLKRMADTANRAGITCHVITPSDALKLWPLIDVEDLELALYIPDDGVSTSSDVCNSMMKGAKQNGVQVMEKTGVKKVVTDGNKVVGVETDKGYIECKVFVNACGLWSRDVGMRSTPEVHVPLHPCEHFYIVTKPMEGVHDMLPTLRDQDYRLYIREWSGGLMCGGFEAKAKPCFYDRTPENFEFQLLGEDWPHFTEHFMDGLMARIPSLKNAEIRQFLNGPESFTPDGNFIVGESPELKNYYVAAALNSNGIVCSASVGKVISELITEGKSSFDISTIDIKRFPRDGNNKMFIRDSVSESLGRHYAIPYPKDYRKAARPMKTSPFYDSLDAAGAEWSVVGGWERADWFNTSKQDNVRSFGKPCWFNDVRNEYMAVKNGIGFVDMSWQSIVEISCTNAALLLQDMQYIFATDIDIDVNSETVSAMLDQYGRYLGIVKLIRTAKDCFHAILSPDEETRFTSWLYDNSNHKSNLRMKTLNGSFSKIALMGKESQKLLDLLCHPDECIADIQKNCSQVLDVGYSSNVRLVRGFLDDMNNWELYVPSQFAVGLRKTMFNHGKKLGIQDVGFYTIDTIRSMKMIPEYGCEINVGTRAVDLETMFYVDHNKPVDFLGKESLSKNATIGHKRLWTLEFPAVDENCWVWGGEPVICDNRQVASLMSPIWNQEKEILTGLVLQDSVLPSSPIEVLVAGVRYVVYPVD